MRAAETPLHMGWVFVWSLMIWQLGKLLTLTHFLPGIIPGYWDCVIGHLFYLVQPDLCLCIGFMWFAALAMFYEGRSVPRCRTLLLLLPSLTLTLYGVWLCTSDPPTPWKFFRRHFHAELPPSAHEIKTGAITQPDPGSFLFYMHCSPTEAMAMVRMMNLEETSPMPEGTERLFYIPSGPYVRDWKDVRYFLKIDEITGTAYIIAAHNSLDEIFILREPGWAKSAEEVAQDMGDERIKTSKPSSL